MIILCCLILFMGLTTILPLTTIGNSSELIAEKPNWQVGDTWTYQRLVKGKFTNFYSQTVAETHARFKGKSSYKVEYKSFNREGKVVEKSRSYWYFSVDDLCYLGREYLDGAIEEPKSMPIKVRWPIKDRKGWRVDHYEPGLSQQVDQVYSASIERIKVEAGDFLTFKIHREFQFSSGGKSPNYIEIWYAPEIKWFIKYFFYSNDSTEELIKYQITH